MSEQKQRIDVLLCTRKLASSRQRAREIITGGFCKADGVVITKPGAMISEVASLVVEGAEFPYVSRGGLKLKKAFDRFGILVEGKVCIDVGASTGGFTDCMLQEKAKGIFAIDTGHDQLADCLKRDARVCSLEGTNINQLTIEDLMQLRSWERPSFASVDVSFVSVTKVLPNVCALLGETAEIVALIKPQFEAGQALIGKKGVVKDKKVHKKVLQDIYLFLHRMEPPLQMGIAGITWSPIKGGEGNIEFLLYLKKNLKQEASSGQLEAFDRIVEEAHCAFK